jgi:hypothetical protein
MAYIGKQPVVGNFVKLDAIVTSATATYNLLNGGVAYYPQTANNCIVSLNGVIQSPTSAYTISGSTIVFDSALTSSDSIDFILVLGDVLSIGTPSDGTVTNAKIAASTIDLTTKVTGTLPYTNGGTGLTTLGTAGQALVVNGGATALQYSTVGATAGQVIQVVQTHKTDSFTVSTATLTDITGLTATITPSSASNKILVITHIAGAARASAGGNLRLLRGSTQIGVADTASNRSLSSFSGNMWITSDHDSARTMSGTYLDSPATTSATTYKVQGKNGTAAALNINRTNNDTDAEDAPGRMTSSITLMEIKG